MTDPRRPDAPAASPDAGSPPATPWWSRPEGDQWGTPDAAQQQPHGTPPAQATSEHDTRPYGAQPYGEPRPYGQQGYGEQGYGEQPYGAQPDGAQQSGGYGSAPQAPSPEDPWSRATTRATFPSGAQPWGAPTDTNGKPLASARARRGGLRTAALVLATALLAGGVGGVVGSRSAEQSLLDPSASLGSGASSTAVVDRAPESVAGIAAKVMRSTVSIAVSGGGARGTGSGVVIRGDGYILTNNHVVAAGAAQGGEITVTFDGAEQEIPAQIVGLDPVTDLAVIQVKTGSKLPAASLGQSRSLVVGDPVIAIGSPLGLSGTVTTGIVSALNRTVNVPGEGGARNPLYNAVQTDAAINPGNSGGALVNARGEVIGINSAIATLGGSPGDAGGSIGVGFAIPIDEARSVAEEIIRTGRATHPSIGVSAENSSPNADRKGALVRELTPGGAAGKSGLEPGDLVVKVNDTEVSSVDELILAIRANKIGDTVTVVYLRDGQERRAQVQLQDLRR